METMRTIREFWLNLYETSRDDEGILRRHLCASEISKLSIMKDNVNLDCESQKL